MSMIELDAQIRARAYEIWQSENCPDGCEKQHWERAAREILTESRSQASAATKPARSKSAGAKGRAKRAA